MRSKRKQYSSCDSCRRSRVACNASQLGHQPGDSRWTGTCSRCTRLKRSCSFQWIRSAKKREHSLPQVSSRHYSHVATETDHTDDPEIVDQEHLDSVLTMWSDSFLRQSLETVLLLAIGNNSCPLVNNFKSTNIPCGIEAFSALDKYVTKETKGIRSSHECNNAEAKKRDDRMDQSLRTTIKAFTARWLPLILNRAISETDGVEELTRKTWRAARTDMLKVINRVSYQSVLTLFLFSQTPIPAGISEEEEEEGISGLLCLHTALLQVQRLRERQSDCQFRGPNVVPWANITTGPGSTPSPGSNFAENYLELENRIYWAAVTWDTSSSLTYNLRASLTSGLKGACLEPVWILARAFLVGSFHPQTEIWRTKGFEVTDETSEKILSAAAVGNVYILKTITSLKEALREGVAEDSLLHTWRAFLDAIDVYRTSIRPLINTCERNLHYLDQGRRLCWFEVSLQYHLGVLTMTDALKVAQRLDLLAQIPQLSQETESDIFNVLKFGVDNAFTIKCVRKEASAEGSNRTAQTPCQMITITIIAIYPFISNVVDSVALAKKAIAFTYSRGEIKDDVYSYLNSILARTLVQLPQCSQRVILARKTYRDWEFPRL